MTHPNRPAPYPVQQPYATLHLQFDVDQDSDALGMYVERNSSPTPNPYPANGLYANTLFFAPDEGVSVDITATAKVVSTFVRFDVIECAILTRPGITERTPETRTRYSPPSLFTESRAACYLLADDFSLGAPSDDGKNKTLLRSWNKKLFTVHQPGNWQLALALTVAIWRDNQVESDIRVFWCDPESEVGGSGTVKV